MLVRKIRNRGANIVVEAHGEVLFAATGDVGRWTNRFSQRVGAFARQEAPSNKRPRWAHYGKPLKSTITATTKYQPGRMRVYSAVGSSAPYAYYVDQGTGIFNGSGPYPAKVLPPYHRGEASLYEHTWRPGGPGTRKVKTVWIRGQEPANEGKGFFGPALERGFRSMRMRSFKVPGEGGPKISGALNAMPTGMEDFRGNTPADGAFIAELETWRSWRDEAWVSHRTLGKAGGQPRSRSKTPAGSKSTAKPNNPTKPKRPPKPKGPSKSALAADKARVLAAAVKHYGAGNVETNSLEYRSGRWYLTVRVKDSQGRWIFKEVHQAARV